MDSEREALRKSLLATYENGDKTLSEICAEWFSETDETIKALAQNYKLLRYGHRTPLTVIQKEFKDYKLSDGLFWVPVVRIRGSAQFPTSNTRAVQFYRELLSRQLSTNGLNESYQSTIVGEYKKFGNFSELHIYLGKPGIEMIICDISRLYVPPDFEIGQMKFPPSIINNRWMYVGNVEFYALLTGFPGLAETFKQNSDGSPSVATLGSYYYRVEVERCFHAMGFDDIESSFNHTILCGNTVRSHKLLLPIFHRIGQ